MKKKCTSCGKVKAEAKFGWRTAKHKVRIPYCKVCRAISHRQWQKRNPTGQARSCRRAALKRCYGLTAEQYKAMLLTQKGLCAICGEPEIAILKGKLLCLAVDHNHKTNQVRALLCKRCNTGLGYFRENPLRLRKAAAYLEYHGT